MLDAFYKWGIYASIAALGLGLVIQIVVTYAAKKEIPKMAVVGLAITIVSGGISYIFQDPVFFQWKPTVVYWCFAIALLVTARTSDQPPLKRLMGKQMSVPDNIWGNAGIGAIIFFILCGVLNLAVAYSVELDTWVKFKVFGMMGITLGGVIALMAYMAPHMKEPPGGNKQSGETK